MRARSARFDRVIVSSHYTLASRVDVLLNRVPIITGLPVSAGDVMYDRNAAVLARATIQVACSEMDHLQPWGRLLPTASIAGPLSAAGYELQPWRGIDYGNGDVELLPLGVFPIQQTTFDLDSLLATVECADRSQQVSDARIEEPYVITDGTNAVEAIRALITAAVPDTTFAFPSTTRTTNANVLPVGADPWEEAQRIARSISYELFFDEYGRCTMQTEPGATTEPAIEIRDGDLDPAASLPQGRLTGGVSLVINREGVYNRVIATGESSSLTEVHRGVATITDPSDPTYYTGPFGHKPRFYVSPFISSASQAQSAAESILASETGLDRGFVFSMQPNPALKVGDVAHVVSERRGIDEMQVIDRFTIELTADSMVDVDGTTAIDRRVSTRAVRL